jgi:hypothetical protein
MPMSAVVTVKMHSKKREARGRLKRNRRQADICSHRWCRLLKIYRLQRRFTDLVNSCGQSHRVARDRKIDAFVRHCVLGSARLIQAGADSVRSRTGEIATELSSIMLNTSCRGTVAGVEWLQPITTGLKE